MKKTIICIMLIGLVPMTVFVEAIHSKGGRREYRLKTDRLKAEGTTPICGI